MRIDELLEKFVDDKGDLSKDLKNLKHSDVERIIAKMNNLQKVLGERKRSIEDKSFNKRPELLTVKEAADYLKVTGQTIHNLKKSGKIKFSKIGGSIRFTYEDLNVYFLQIKEEFALCITSIIKVDHKTQEVLPFEKEYLYRIVHENRIWIYVFNMKWGNRMRFSKKEFRKYFTIPEEYKVDASKFNMAYQFS
jgi:excisionase family DNA binding protein